MGHDIWSARALGWQCLASKCSALPLPHKPCHTIRQPSLPCTNTPTLRATVCHTLLQYSDTLLYSVAIFRHSVVLCCNLSTLCCALLQYFDTLLYSVAIFRHSVFTLLQYFDTLLCSAAIFRHSVVLCCNLSTLCCNLSTLCCTLLQSFDTLL